jgi:hypothetical protein
MPIGLILRIFILSEEGEKMTLKHARIGRAENLSTDLRLQHHLPSEGFIIIESRNPALSERFISIGEGGIRAYLLTLGLFRDIPIDE